MTTLREAAQQALEALKEHGAAYMHHEAEYRKAITALRAALEQPVQGVPETDCGNMEPLAWLESPYGSIRMNTTMRFQFPPQSLKWKIPLYTHPPRREWRGLKEWEINDGLDQLPTEDVCSWSFRKGVYFAEAALKEKNND